MSLNSIFKLVESKRKIVVPLFFFGYLIVGLLIFDDYGLSWDEGLQRTVGMRNYAYIFYGNQELVTHKDRFYGPVFELFLIHLENVLNLSDVRVIYLMRHLINFLLFYTSVFFFYLICKQRFQDWKVGLLGSLFLILSPRIFAHSFYNSKDLSFLSMFIISVYTLIEFLNKKTLLRAFIHSLACAILIDIRILGVLVPCITMLFIASELMLTLRSLKIKIRNNNIVFSLLPFYKSTKMNNLIQSFFLYIILLIFFTILFWPTLWINPASNFIKAVQYFSYFPDDVTVLYRGEFISDKNLPWHYIPTWIGITTPILYLFYFFVGLIITVLLISRNPMDFIENQTRYDLIFMLWFFTPLIYVIVFKSVLYDGWRQLYFIYPALLVISLKGLISQFKFIKLKLKGRVYETVKILLVLIVLNSLIGTTFFMVRNHPFQSVYFNRLTGKDLESVVNNFELDYWGLSYQQALIFILENDSNKVIKIFVDNMPGELNSDILTPSERIRLEYVNDLNMAKYYLSNYRWPKEKHPLDKEFYSISVDGVKIMVVYKLE